MIIDGGLIVIALIFMILVMFLLNLCQNLSNIYCALYTYQKWCRSKSIARGTLLIAREALFMYTSL